ncbi:MAG: hypothetical protein MJ014_00010 [Methanocorpusculum sp.]|nr:hypothetical protein [Methanocorpusculum sp.]
MIEGQDPKQDQRSQSSSLFGSEYDTQPVVLTRGQLKNIVRALIGIAAVLGASIGLPVVDNMMNGDIHEIADSVNLETAFKAYLEEHPEVIVKAFNGCISSGNIPTPLTIEDVSTYLKSPDGAKLVTVSDKTLFGLLSSGTVVPKFTINPRGLESAGTLTIPQQECWVMMQETGDDGKAQWVKTSSKIVIPAMTYEFTVTNTGLYTFTGTLEQKSAVAPPAETAKA